jgi:RHS repeat-associated protein
VLKTVNWNQGPGVSLNYGYDANGNVTNLWSGTAGGVNLAYRYDPLNRLTNVAGQVSRLAEYAYDGVGNLQTAGYGNGVTNQYQYDALNRLTNETISALGSVGYGYDAVGNRTNRASGISGLATANSSYSANDWLTSDQYDANGNTTNSASVAYRYDVLNRLVDYNHGAVTLGYNGDGQRVVKNVGGAVTYYLVDDRNPSGYAQVLEEITAFAGTTNLTKVYAYGLDLISQQQPGVATNYYGHDGHGSVRYLTGTSGDITDIYAYDAYGNLMASSGSTANNYLYCGEQYDPQLKFYYNRARYLNPDTGRFWTMDTFAGDNEDPLSLHKYLYCQGNPVNNTDPSGNDIGEMLSVMDIGGMLTQIGAPVAIKALSTAEGDGGPDVTVSLNKTLDDVKQKFTALPDPDAKACCKRMTEYSSGGYTKAWDIGILFDIGADHSDKYGWSRTVTFNSYVYYAGAVNYALWGEMFALAHQRFGHLGLVNYDVETALSIATAWKARQYGLNNEALQALWFTRYGYDRSSPPPAAAGALTVNFTPITAYQGSFSVEDNWKWFPNDVMGWKWLPNLNANSGIP